jgi:pyruvate ferredoxin oxidoreductase gamma subunit
LFINLLQENSMIEVRFHGRGGQGAVTSSELMALAAISEKKYAQAFPSFGPERRGAPLQAYLRISGQPITLREEVYNPDIVLVIDPALVNSPAIKNGLGPDKLLVVNSAHGVAEIRKNSGFSGRLAHVDATAIAQETLGVPITNTTMLGALLKANPGLVSLDSLVEPIKQRFGKNADKNLCALKRAFDETKIAE